MRVHKNPPPLRLPDASALDRVLDEPLDAFKAEGPTGLPVIPRISFARPAAAVVGPAAAERDARVDAAAHELAEALRKQGYGVRLTGARAGQADMLRGVLARAYKGTGRTFGEVYCRLDIDVPGVKQTQHLALMKHRENNAPTYVQEKAELMLGFVDSKSGKLWGSGYGLDSSLLDCPGADVPARSRALVSEIVGKLEDFKKLNAKKPRRS